MGSRALWQGTLAVQRQEVAVKFYSAVEDRQIHFHLLHKRDRTRVQQRMVTSDSKTPVPLEETQKAFEAEPGVFVAISRDEIAKCAPRAARVVRVSQCVPMSAIAPPLFDRPYFLGPGGDSADDYFALAQTLDRKELAGIATWVMRQHSYVGALISQRGYLMIITLRHVEEVIPIGDLAAPEGSASTSKEKELATKLIDALSGRFDPKAYHDQYQEHLHELIDAKQAGKKVKARPVRRGRTEGSLADALSSSLKRVSASRKA